MLKTSLVLMLSMTLFAQEQTVRGKCTKVVHGNLIVIMLNGEQQYVRLREAICPDPGQRFHKDAAQFARAQVKGRLVAVTYEHKNKAGELIGEVVYGPRISLANQLIGQGYAFWHPAWGKSQVFKSSELQAKARKKGLWASEEPARPYAYEAFLKQRNQEQSE